jgi:hypothetical protein
MASIRSQYPVRTFQDSSSYWFFLLCFTPRNMQLMCWKGVWYSWTADQSNIYVSFLRRARSNERHELIYRPIALCPVSIHASYRHRWQLGSYVRSGICCRRHKMRPPGTFSGCDNSDSMGKRLLRLTLFKPVSMRSMEKYITLIHPSTQAEPLRPGVGVAQ